MAPQIRHKQFPGGKKDNIVCIDEFGHSFSTSSLYCKSANVVKKHSILNLITLIMLFVGSYGWVCWID